MSTHTQTNAHTRTHTLTLRSCMRTPIIPRKGPFVIAALVEDRDRKSSYLHQQDRYKVVMLAANGDDGDDGDENDSSG